MKCDGDVDSALLGDLVGAARAEDVLGRGERVAEREAEVGPARGSAQGVGGVQGGRRTWRHECGELADHAGEDGRVVGDDGLISRRVEGREVVVGSGGGRSWCGGCVERVHVGVLKCGRRHPEDEDDVKAANELFVERRAGSSSTWLIARSLQRLQGLSARAARRQHVPLDDRRLHSSQSYRPRPSLSCPSCPSIDALLAPLAPACPNGSTGVRSPIPPDPPLPPLDVVDPDPCEPPCCAPAAPPPPAPFPLLLLRGSVRASTLETAAAAAADAPGDAGALEAE